MKFPAFAYVRPDTLEEAIGILCSDDEARPLAGGQSLLPVMALRLAAPGTLVDLGGIPTLRAIELDPSGTTLRIGAMSTHAKNSVSPLVKEFAPLMTQALEHVAHEAVRNRGTIGGSLVNADSCAEMPFVTTALNAVMVLRSSKGERTVLAENFFLGHFSTALQPGELLVRIDVPLSTVQWEFEEVARRPGDFALVMVAVGLEIFDQRCEGARVFIGCMGDRAIRAKEAEAFLHGKFVDEPVIEQMIELALKDIAGRSDIHASAESRRQLVRAVLRRATRRCLQQESA
ncbi:xanthine dehydrogenase small subunit [Alcaligenes phenolicus]